MDVKKALLGLTVPLQFLEEEWLATQLM